MYLGLKQLTASHFANCMANVVYVSNKGVNFSNNYFQKTRLSSVRIIFLQNMIDDDDKIKVNHPQEND